MKLLESIDVRLLAKNDIPQMAHLMNSHYARQRSEAYFDWQYFRSAYPTRVSGAFHGSQLIGMLGLQKRSTESGAMGGQLIDMIVDTPWRGKGIFQQLGDAVGPSFPDIDFLCVLPNAAGKAAVEKNFQFKCIGQLALWCLPRPGQQVTDLADTPPTPAKALEVFRYDMPTIQWRFRNHPEFEYSWVLSGADTAIVKVYSDKTTNRAYGDIVHWSLHTESAASLAQLLFKAGEFLFSKGVDEVATWAQPQERYAESLRLAGFLPRSQERYFCIKALNDRYPHLADYSRWSLSPSDAEHY